MRQKKHPRNLLGAKGTDKLMNHDAYHEFPTSSQSKARKYQT